MRDSGNSSNVYNDEKKSFFFECDAKGYEVEEIGYFVDEFYYKMNDHPHLISFRVIISFWQNLLITLKTFTLVLVVEDAKSHFYFLLLQS